MRTLPVGLITLITWPCPTWQQLGTAQRPWEPPHSCRKHGKPKEPKQPGSLHTAVENIENLRTYAISSIRRRNKHGRPPSVTKCFSEKPKQPGNRSIKNSHRTWTSDAGPNMKTLSSNTGNIPKLIRIMTYAVDSIDCSSRVVDWKNVTRHYSETVLFRLCAKTICGEFHFYWSFTGVIH